jgi:hypothetical protein
LYIRGKSSFLIHGCIIGAGIVDLGGIAPCLTTIRLLPWTSEMPCFSWSLSTEQYGYMSLCILGSLGIKDFSCLGAPRISLFLLPRGHVLLPRFGRDVAGYAGCGVLTPSQCTQTVWLLKSCGCNKNSLPVACVPRMVYPCLCPMSSS